MHDVGTKSLGEFIDCRLQPALPSKGAEKIELNPIIDADQVVGDQTNQAEGTWMLNLVEEIDANRVECLGNVGRFTEPALTGQDLKIRGLEFYAHAKGNVALLSETPADPVG